jgi:hypothetical protein
MCLRVYVCMHAVYSYCHSRGNTCYIHMRAHICEAECVMHLYIAQLASYAVHVFACLYAHEQGIRHITFTVARRCMYEHVC